MKTPSLALHLVAATLLASAWPAHAEAFHGSAGLAGSMVGYAKSLSSDWYLAGPVRLTGGAAFSRTRTDLGAGAPMLGDVPSGPSLAATSQTALDHELAQLRDGIARVRFMPQVSLGMTLRF